MAKTIFEEMGGKYERQGDYLIPCLTVPAEEEQPIGIWGQRHLDYLNFLSGGCSRSPIDLLKGAGVDMTGPEPVVQALELFDRLLDEMEALTEEADG